MATKTFNDICVEYAHQLGKGLPLTAPEMCNAVIMYLNAQITEMQGITTALQTAVAEAEASATEATNTANELSEKVDTLQTNVTEAESNATEALNTANDVSETVNALPKVPTPTTSDNGKVIGVQSGAYALVEQSGGEAPANMVTTDTVQTISAKKIFDNDENTGLLIVKKNEKMINIYGDSIGWSNGEIDTYLEFNNNTSVSSTILLPNRAGTLAMLSDIPDLKNYLGNIDLIQGTAGSGIAVHDTVKASPYTKYGYDKIETYGNSNSLQYTLNIPNKNGTIATLDDIGASGSKKYLHNIIVMSDENIGIYFSIITERGSSYTSLNDMSNDIATMGVISATGWDRTSGAYSPIFSIQHDNGEFKYSYISDSIMSVYLPPLVEVTDNVIEL